MGDFQQYLADMHAGFHAGMGAGGIRERQLRLDAPALMVGCGLAMRRFDE